MTPIATTASWVQSRLASLAPAPTLFTYTPPG